MNSIPGRRCSNFCICDLSFPFEILLWQTSLFRKDCAPYSLTIFISTLLSTDPLTRIHSPTSAVPHKYLQTMGWKTESHTKMITDQHYPLVEVHLPHLVCSVLTSSTFNANTNPSCHFQLGFIAFSGKLGALWCCSYIYQFPVVSHLNPLASFDQI